VIFGDATRCEWPVTLLLVVSASLDVHPSGSGMASDRLLDYEQTEDAPKKWPRVGRRSTVRRWRLQSEYASVVS
jgi:hypothetical protein